MLCSRGNLGSHKVYRDAGATLPGGAVPKRVDASFRPAWTTMCPNTIRCARSMRSSARWIWRSWTFGTRKNTAGPGQPAYDPRLLLKLYLYGYQHRCAQFAPVGSGDATEPGGDLAVPGGPRRATRRSRIFRKDNASALRAANREFILLCRELSLLEGRRVAVDGTFLKANANVDGIHTKASLGKGLKRLDEKITEYHRLLDEGGCRIGGWRGQRGGSGTSGEDRGSGGKAQAQAVFAGTLAGKRGEPDIGRSIRMRGC